MFEFMFQIITLLKSRGKNVSCLFLSYDLAPGRVYPRQLQQGAMLLNHAISTLSISPKNIILTGDSAGANLALGLLSHISHPHPGLNGVDVPKVDLKGEKLKGAVLISPWVSFNLDDESWKRNEYKDVLCKPAGQQWSSAFVNHPSPIDPASDYYNQAITAPASWWEGAMVEEVFIVAGEEEVLVDGITEFAGTFGKGVGESRVEFKVFEGEYHDQPSIDLHMGYKESQEGEQAKAIKGWIASKL
jgi:acetyl esterase/lipase